MRKREIFLLSIACSFVGIVLGFLLSPIKAGFTIASNNSMTETEKPDS